MKIKEKALPLPANRVYLSHTISEPAFDSRGETLFYVRLVNSRRAVIRQSLASGLAQQVTTEPLPKGGVGYGGGIFALHGETVVYAAEDGRLHGISLRSGAQWKATPAFEGVAAPAISPCGRFVAFIAEQGGRCNAFLADLAGGSPPVKLSGDPWYAFNPAFSPDGSRVAWQEWDSTSMPWQESRLQIARFAVTTQECGQASELLPLRTTVLAKRHTSYASPRFSPCGRHLAFTSDETGWRSLWVADRDGRGARRIETGEGEIGRPDWVPGLKPVCWAGDGRSIYAVRRHRARDTVLRVSWPEAATTEVVGEWTSIEGFDLLGHHLALVASSPVTPPALVTLNLRIGDCAARATAAVGTIDPRPLAAAECISWKGPDAETVWGVLYRASGAEAPDRHPLIVHVHGGPTSDKPLEWDAQAQYFATRGWHYLFVNYRGSTGYGRAYQEALNGRWGEVDVEDAHSGALHLVDMGIADPKRLVIMGGSAGGYTTLLALIRHPGFWAGGVSLYGVADLFDLKEKSHRFELPYEETLVGGLPESAEAWKERSPLTHAERVRAPVLLFHGTEDKAVPLNQSEALADAIRRAGGSVDLVVYEGEGHGFQKEASRRDVIEKTEEFLRRVALRR